MIIRFGKIAFLVIFSATYSLLGVLLIILKVRLGLNITYGISGMFATIWPLYLAFSKLSIYNLDKNGVAATAFGKGILAWSDVTAVNLIAPKTIALYLKCIPIHPNLIRLVKQDEASSKSYIPIFTKFTDADPGMVIEFITMQGVSRA